LKASWGPWSLWVPAVGMEHPVVQQAAAEGCQGGQYSAIS
jgi:hypothetical protein